ncbi:MAG: glycosyltransferase [Coleofasciculus sp. G1-WW12-02]|uniref:glycosyltransferase n=1 Tax=Coleofasciculus sp. G1-WW12-02 TaxID=3068483 RepID=UPI00330497F8
MLETQPRIAVYLRMLSGGGAERVMVNLTSGFVERGVKVDLVLNIVEGPYLAQVPSEVRIVDLKDPRLLSGLPKLARYLRQEQPVALLSALHYNNEIAIWAKRLAGVSTRVVVSERNTLSIHARHQKDSERWSPILARLFYPWADGIVAVSHGVANDLSKVTGLSQSRIRVIYNPVNTSEVLKKAKEPVEHPWFAKGEPPVILGLGRLNKQKNFSTLIRAFSQVQQVQPCRLVIVGRGPERQKLNNLVRELGLEEDVTMVGFSDNPYAYMAQAKVFVLSSAWEGLPNVLIEAMVVGTPVISTNCPSGPVEILDNGKYGLLVPLGDIETMTKALLGVLSGDSKSVVPAWLEQFTLESATEQYLDVLGIAIQ